MEALKGQLAVPPLMAAELMFPTKDPLFPKHYVLLQDGGQPEDDAK